MNGEGVAVWHHSGHASDVRTAHEWRSPHYMRGQQPERWGWEKYLAFPEAHAAALVDVAEALRAALDPEVIDDTALATKLARAYIAALDRLDAAKATP